MTNSPHKIDRFNPIYNQRQFLGQTSVNFSQMTSVSPKGTSVNFAMAPDITAVEMKKGTPQTELRTNKQDLAMKNLGSAIAAMANKEKQDTIESNEQTLD